MRHYEIIFMVHPDKNEHVQNLINTLYSIVKKLNGNVHRLEDWGLRHLAYRINKLHKAHYVLLNIEIPIKGIKEIENSLIFNESVIRSMIVCVKSAIKDPSVMLTQVSGSEQKIFENRISIFEKEKDE